MRSFPQSTIHVLFMLELSGCVCDVLLCCCWYLLYALSISPGIFHLFTSLFSLLLLSFSLSIDVFIYTVASSLQLLFDSSEFHQVTLKWLNCEMVNSNWLIEYSFHAHQLLCSFNRVHPVELPAAHSLENWYWKLSAVKCVNFSHLISLLIHERRTAMYW